MNAEGDEGTRYVIGANLLSWGPRFQWPAKHAILGHRLAPTGKGLPTRLPALAA